MKEAIQRKDDKTKQNDPLQRREDDAVQMKEMSPPPFSLDAAPAQMKGEEEEESLQMKAAPAQMKGEEEEESLQMKADTAQLKGEEEEESLQA